MLVVPRELLARRLYTASAIGLALAVWALLGSTEAEARTRVSPLAFVGTGAQDTWVTLRRWATATAKGRLFATVTSRAPPSAGLSLRRQAERAAAALAVYNPRLVSFQREQGMKELPWTELATERVRDAAALRGRDRMRAALDALGFPVR